MRSFRISFTTHDGHSDVYSCDANSIAEAEAEHRVEYPETKSFAASEIIEPPTIEGIYLAIGITKDRDPPVEGILADAQTGRMLIMQIGVEPETFDHWLRHVQHTANVVGMDISIARFERVEVKQVVKNLSFEFPCPSCGRVERLMPNDTDPDDVVGEEATSKPIAVCDKCDAAFVINPADKTEPGVILSDSDIAAMDDKSREYVESLRAFIADARRRRRAAASQVDRLIGKAFRH